MEKTVLGLRGLHFLWSQEPAGAQGRTGPKSGWGAGQASVLLLLCNVITLTWPGTRRCPPPGCRLALLSLHTPFCWPGSDPLAAGFPPSAPLLLAGWDLCSAGGLSGAPAAEISPSGTFRLLVSKSPLSGLATQPPTHTKPLDAGWYGWKGAREGVHSPLLSPFSFSSLC